MKRIAAVVFFLSSSAVWADPVLVRTAEHGDFTRIVVDFPRPPEWELTQDGRKLRLGTKGRHSYDLDQVYRRINDDRVQRISQAGSNSLELDLACDCEARSATRSGGGIIIDIWPSRVSPPPERLRRTLDHIEVPSILPGILTAGIESGTDTPASEALAERADELRRRLEPQFNAAVHEGLIDADEIPEEVPSDPLPAKSSSPDPFALPPGPGLRSRNVETTRLSDIPARTLCPDYAGEPLRAWGRDLSQETTDEDLLLGEARRLIARGLGAEALSAVSTLDQPDPVLVDMARTLDGYRSNGALAASAECGPVLSLFALIADGSEAPSGIRPVLTALDQIDEPLRGQLGRRAVSRLSVLGREEDAMLVRNRLAGAADEDAPTVRTTGDHDTLIEVARRTPEASDAIAGLIDGMVSRGEEVPVWLIDQAQSLSAELSGQERDSLARSMIRARIASGALTAADAEIQRLARRDAELAHRLRTELFASLLSVPDDATFLKKSLRLATRPAEDEAMRLALARRAFDLHVPDLARSLLGGGTEIPGRAERLLRAEIAISEGALENAVSYLAGLDGPDVERIGRQIAAARPPAPAIELLETPQGLQARSQALLDRSATLRDEVRLLVGSP